MTSCHPHGDGPVTVIAQRRIALVGSPNAGKTSLFNHLTGLRAKTGNYPGVTVGRSVGIAKVDGAAIAIEDLPGTYSLDPISPDEQVVADLLAGEFSDADRPDAIVLVADVTTLRRSIALVAQVLQLDLPCLLALTMSDELSLRGGQIDAEALSAALGIPVTTVVAHRGSGLDGLCSRLASFQQWGRPPIFPPSDHDGMAAWGESVLDAAGYVAPHPDRRTTRIDRLVLHPLWGILIFFPVMFAFFQVVFTVTEPLRDWIAQGLTWLGTQAGDHIGNPVLRGLFGQAIIGGVGTVLQFLPQIMLLYLLIGLLESVGYMSRAAFLMDRVMARTGLEGRAFVAMLSSFACAIPGMMATRTLPSSRDRIATIVTAPLMTCSARLPVYTLLIGLLVAPQTRWWGLSAQGVTMFLLYLGGGTSALIAARVVKSTILRSDLLPFTMELPPYRLPSVKTMLVAMWSPAKMFLRKAGTIILAVSVVL
ncbi:MAG TPA: ferrous iron transporter B, partial [Acetobacteraceae bacterium]|nr:ferrous iron transporter B [Acetobacteraceae bacterium]